jgi:aryl-phospho-beta-D-glucosidase BglC (GH1 family)
MRMLSSAKVAIAAALATAAMAQAQTLPTAKSIAAEMGLGWNLGNTMEATGGPTAWGNFVPPQSFIDSVKKAGFNTIRLPVAWDGNANQTTYQINSAWMTQVKGLVDMCIKDSLFVVLNIHWDGGWLENNIDKAATDPALKAKIIAKQGAYWRQIATTFRNYDRHLLFAGTNEPNVADAASQAVLKEFLQVFIDTVRATGGNNASRTLIVQGPSTDIEKTYKLMTTIPTDKIADRLMAEVHFYPYQFALMTEDAEWGKVFHYWGKNNHSLTDPTRNPTWGEEAFVDSVFTLMKTQFVDKNIPVLLGEFGAVKRTTLTGDAYRLHVQSRRSFYEHVAKSAKARGILPVAWDAGGLGDLTMSVFDRKTGEIFDLGLLNALRSGWGMAKLPGDTALVPVFTGSKAMKGLYSAKDSMFGQINLGVLKPDWTSYDSVKVRAFVNGTTTYDSVGTRYGFLNLNLVTMSNEWTWREATLGTVAMDAWKTYGLRIANDTTGGALAPALRSKVDFFALQAYSKGYRGSIYIDWIAFRSTSGTWDTLYTYDFTPASEATGNFDGVKLIPVADVAADQEWKTATTTKYGTTSVQRRTVGDAGLRATVRDGMLRATWTSPVAGATHASLQDLQGRTLWSGTIQAHEGLNSLQLPTAHRGLAILNLRTPTETFSAKTTSH